MQEKNAIAQFIIMGWGGRNDGDLGSFRQLGV